MNLKIVVAVNKKDLWFCRICVASIRYYYPEIAIYLLKDELNGAFSTTEIELNWNVKVFDLHQKKFGWAASKTFFLLQAPVGEQFLILDSDIVFAGPFLERIIENNTSNDIVVSADYCNNPYANWISNIYFDVKAIQNYDSNYHYPGFFFNTGQLFIKGGTVKESDLNGLFDSQNFPYWTNQALFPLVDQSVYNYVFPLLSQSGKLKLGEDQFMIWSDDIRASVITVESLKNRSNLDGLIHWAGSFRNPVITKMKNSQLLFFFEQFYYSRIKGGNLLRHTRKIRPACQLYLGKLYRVIKTLRKSSK